MPQNIFFPNASTSQVNIDMECVDEENIYRNEPKPPLINIISSDGTSRCINADVDTPGQELTQPTPRPRQKKPAATSRQGSYNTTPEQVCIELPSLHTTSCSSSAIKEKAITQPSQETQSLLATNEASNQNNNLSARDDLSTASEYYTPTGPGSFFLTPNVRTALHRSLNSHVSSAVPSYRTALNVTPPSGYISDAPEHSSSRIINSMCSRLRHPLGRHARLDIRSSIRSSPSRSIHLKPSCSDHCLLGSSLLITGALMFMLSVICLAFIDNTVPDHEDGIHAPIYEALYALKGQSRPINSFKHIIIEDANVGVIPVHPSGIQDYSETHLNSEHGPYNMFDNDISTNWNPVFKEERSRYSITVDLKNNYTMTAVRIKDFGNYENDVTDFLLEVQRDGVWRLVLRYPTLPPGHKLKEINGFAVWGTLWKFTVLGTASGQQPLIKELQFFGFKEETVES